MYSKLHTGYTVDSTLSGHIGPGGFCPNKAEKWACPNYRKMVCWLILFRS